MLDSHGIIEVTSSKQRTTRSGPGLYPSELRAALSGARGTMIGSVIDPSLHLVNVNELETARSFGVHAALHGQVLPDGYNYSNGSYVCLDGWFGSAEADPCPASCRGRHKARRLPRVFSTSTYSFLGMRRLSQPRNALPARRMRACCFSLVWDVRVSFA